MHFIRIFGFLLFAAVMLPSEILAAEGKPAATFSFEGVVDSITRADATLVLKNTAPNKIKTVELKIDDKTQITIDKKPATVADLVVGDKAWANFAQGIAMKIAITRVPVQAPANK